MQDPHTINNHENTIENTSATIKYFKSFGEKALHIPSIRQINLVVGRNNVGKSSVLDAIEILCRAKDISQNQYHNRNGSNFSIQGNIGGRLAAQYFPQGTSGGYIRENFWSAVGRYVQNCGIEVNVSAKGRHSLVNFTPTEELKRRTVRDGYGHETPLIDHSEFQQSINGIAQMFGNPYEEYKVFRVDAERDVRPEARSANLSMRSNGSGLTNTICQILTSVKHDSSLIEQEFRTHINSILYPDMNVDGISAQEHEDGSWELFFDEAGKGLVSLSNSGSGIKTVIIVVAATFLLPKLRIISPTKTIFMIEEPENNLHPALQRRLSDYLFRIVHETDNKIIVTSHSSALMDAFSAHQDSQIIHVTANGGETDAISVQNMLGRRHVLDDLDAKASDLLLSNGVVWVEGPSDRTYIKAMINLIADGALVEGVHYQCVFYGGRLLSHLEADIESGNDVDSMSIFRVSRHAAIVIDSDKKDDDGKINNTKNRIVAEINSSDGFAWVTDGREFENYLPASSLAKLDSRLGRSLSPYEEIETYLSELIGDAEGKSLIRSKSDFAEKICENFTLEDLISNPILHQRISELAREISKWNGMAQSWAVFTSTPQPH